MHRSPRNGRGPIERQRTWKDGPAETPAPVALSLSPGVYHAGRGSARSPEDSVRASNLDGLRRLRLRRMNCTQPERKDRRKGPDPHERRRVAGLREAVTARTTRPRTSFRI